MSPVLSFPSSGQPEPRSGVPRRQILSALSYALDLTEGAVPGHAERVCLYALRMAEELGFTPSEQAELYYAALLKDVGCSSNSGRMCVLIGGDDRLMKRDVKFLDWTRPSVAAVVALWRRALPNGSAMERMARIARLAMDQHTNNRTMIELRCDRGASIAHRIGLPVATADAIHFLDEHWDGSGYPDRLRGDAIPMSARILAVAQHLDVFASETGPGMGLEEAMRELNARNRRWFDPELVRIANLLHHSGELARIGAVDDLHQAVLDREPESEGELADSDIDSICQAFAAVVDAKSSFTFTHSIGVTDAAVAIARELGLAPTRVQRIYRAALLHDLGKLSVSNTILDKPGRLTAEEFAVIKGHSRISEQILRRIERFEDIARIAGQHHEKLDGSGYPDGLVAAQLALDSRILTVADIYGALSEKRPYRDALETTQVIEIMRQDVPTKLDPDCFEALMRVLHGGLNSGLHRQGSPTASAI
jgi:putative nucleotidyltransferase with HDIG domain